MRKALKEQEPILKDWAQKLVEKCSESANAHQPVDMVRYWNFTTFDIIADLTFGEGLGMLTSGEYHAWVTTIFANLKFAARLAAIKTLHPILRTFVRDFVEHTEVAERRRQAHFNFSVQRLDQHLTRKVERPDFWTRILSRDDTQDAFSMDEQYETASLFMVAGTETSASALSGTTYYLLRNPRCLDKLATELRTTFRSFEDLSLTQLARCQYLQACIQEGLRVYPPLPIMPPRRTPPGGCVIDGWWVAGNTKVDINQYAAHHDEEAFHRAHEYIPERWLSDKSDEFKNDRLDSVEPFNIGPRNCLGQV
ncbi:Cytochrome P450 monooxygenase [Pseudocercospora fuligena]|uniref:Cytochrome P450 monooxygenase n=1 Tax=Pseudocercospora fuligena TaxID=685502 RepID=A0A8H6RIN3_9PEZI|nr:Cytochrome P450 monooxygenase [Pseudocercospora fuligena]